MSCGKLLLVKCSFIKLIINHNINFRKIFSQTMLVLYIYESWIQLSCSSSVYYCRKFSWLLLMHSATVNTNLLALKAWHDVWQIKTRSVVIVLLCADGCDTVFCKCKPSNFFRNLNKAHNWVLKNKARYFFPLQSTLKPVLQDQVKIAAL